MSQGLLDAIMEALKGAGAGSEAIAAAEADFVSNFITRARGGFIALFVAGGET
jgi:hypothetical protein